MKSSSNRNVMAGVSALASGTVASFIGVRLNSYGLPFSLTLACAMAVWASLLTALNSAADDWNTTTHRCSVSGCDFTVRLRYCDAAENRRWQEIATAHPTHRTA
ncbi:hypothetical protein ACFVWZ_04745 [Streptomyces sp. NPDC058200]|uniref:hypothetical protein n=1 Tax=Streptomyces sp. NPDC058200 TaxID=3346378 RepID=UPI0036DFDEAF